VNTNFLGVIRPGNRTPDYEANALTIEPHAGKFAYCVLRQGRRDALRYTFERLDR